MIDILVRPLLRRRMAPSLALLIAVTMTGTMAMHVFVPAMPAAAADLGTSPSLIQSTITLYIVGLAAGQLIYGPLSDRFGRRPVLLVSLAPGTQAAGVFTQNRFCAAPVTLCREHLAHSASVRALVVNAGNANAGTGERGLADARATCAAVAGLLDCAADTVLPFSTGVIMEPLPVERIVAALPACRDALDELGWPQAMRAIMTTDTVPKGASRRIELEGQPITVTGIAKGAGMIAPNMATMLGFIATDAPIARLLLETLVADVAAASFNRISIDGDTSTNDSFVLFSTQRAPVGALGDSNCGVGCEAHACAA